MKKINEKYTNKIFESIKYIDEYGNEYWLARELQKVLEYKEWRNFKKVIDKAISSAKNSVSNEEDWLVEVNKPIKTGFAIQTRKQEITEQEYDSLSDDEKRFYQRKLTKQGNYTLQKVASDAGVKKYGRIS